MIWLNNIGETMSDVGFKINPALRPLWDRVKNKRPLYEALKSVGMEAIEENFATEGKRLPVPWAERKKEYGHPMLQKSGHMASSIQSGATGESAWWGTNVKYAKAHVEGMTINVPARSQVINFRRITRGKNKGTRFSKPKKAQFSQKVYRKAYSFKMPKRNPFEFTDDDFRKMNETLGRILLN